MKTRFKPSETNNAGSTSVSDRTSLDINTPCGLFEGSRGNRYLVTVDDDGNGDAKVAILVSGRSETNFNALELGLEPLDYGTWRGWYRLRLTSYLPGEATDLPPGTIVISERHAALVSRVQKRRTIWLPLGDGGQEALELCGHYNTPFCDFDGWALEPAYGDSPFCEASPPGERSWVLDLKPVG